MLLFHSSRNNTSPLLSKANQELNLKEFQHFFLLSFELHHSGFVPLSLGLHYSDFVPQPLFFLLILFLMILLLMILLLMILLLMILLLISSHPIDYFLLTLHFQSDSTVHNPHFQIHQCILPQMHKLHLMVH